MNSEAVKGIQVRVASKIRVRVVSKILVREILGRATPASPGRVRIDPIKVAKVVLIRSAIDRN